jgi:glycopeptide antibiotics resistance protein
MIKFLFKLKTIFHVSNIFLIFLFTYPGSFLGCFAYNDCNFDPRITRDFFISSNHLYAFIILSTLGIFAYKNDSKINILISYLFFLSIFLELLHFVIPVRAFELRDLFGNLFGVFLVVLIYKILKKYEKFKK